MGNWFRKLVLGKVADLLIEEVSKIDDKDVEAVKAKIVALIQHFFGL